jgi:hypothetical protein
VPAAAGIGNNAGAAIETRKLTKYHGHHLALVDWGSTAVATPWRFMREWAICPATSPVMRT